MSSRRFPGKVLAPFRGRPLVRHVLDAVERAFAGTMPATVVTSVDPTDDPLASYLESEGIDVFRGDLENVFGRFRACLLTRPCDWVLRINADSPLMSATVLRRVAERGESGCDVVTTTRPRTFPVGQNAELIRAALFADVDDAELTDEDREHVTGFFYRQPDRFRTVNVSCADPARAALPLAVDTVDDLHRLEALTDAEVRALVDA
jgi:spore coat polysaccharide biosynthesis protein SpsF (cytidylyltransferase family)